jgi:hypothetical protein
MNDVSVVICRNFRLPSLKELFEPPCYIFSALDVTATFGPKGM